MPRKRLPPCSSPFPTSGIARETHEGDRRDILALAATGLFTAQEFKKRVSDAVRYFVVGQPRMVERNIDQVMKEIELLQSTRDAKE